MILDPGVTFFNLATKKLNTDDIEASYSSMDDLMKDLRKEFEYIIIDTPPVGLVTDGVITMKYSDINLYVVRHNYTKKNMLNMINNLHSTNQVNNTNIIINEYNKYFNLNIFYDYFNPHRIFLLIK